MILRRMAVPVPLLLAVLMGSPRGALAKPVPLASLFAEPAPPEKSKKKKKKKPPAPKLPEEYRIFARAREAFEKKSDPGALESAQRELLLAPLHARNKAIEKDFEELFFALEIKKGIAHEKRKNREKALESFEAGLGGLGTFKWVHYWREEASSALVRICGAKKFPRVPACLALARRVTDAFPKAANETKSLRALSLPEPVAQPDFGGERLTIGYSEKKERDEEAFQEALDHYLKGRESDFLKAGRAFLSDFPRSSLRFRTMFLLGETLLGGSNRKEAEGYYRSIIEQSPLSYYSIVSAERLDVDLRTKLSAEPLVIDPEVQVLAPADSAALERALVLQKLGKTEELGIELDGFSKPKAYSNDVILYLMKIATEGRQHLVAFRLANELIQRRFSRMASREMLDLLFPDAFEAEIAAEATTAGQDPILIASLIKQESGFRDSALSSSGAMGLMQLMPFTAIDVRKELKLHELRDPKTNIALGVKYFQGLMSMYNGNPVFSLAAYNAGPHRVMKWRKEAGIRWGMLDWIEAIPFKETREYVTSILRNRYWYQVKKGLPVARITDLKGLTVLPPLDKN